MKLALIIVLLNFGVKPGFSTLGVEVASTTSSPTVSSDAGVASLSATARLERVRGLFSSATVVSSFFSGAAVVSSAFSVAAVVSSFFSAAAVVSSVFLQELLLQLQLLLLVFLRQLHKLLCRLRPYLSSLLQVSQLFLLMCFNSVRMYNCLTLYKHEP